MPVLRFSLLLVLLGLPTVSLGQIADDSPLLLSGARLFLGDGRVVEAGELLIEDGAIAALGPVGSLESAAQYNRLDLSGKTILPALIDAHAHIGYQGRDDWGADQYTVDNIVDNLEQYAYYGFAAVFSAGSDSPDLAAAVESRRAQEGFARLLIAAGMAPPDQGPNNQFLEQVQQIERARGETILWGLAEASQARQLVDGVVASGLNFIKLWVDDRGGSQLKLSPALYRAAIEQAQGHDIRVFIHQQYARDMPDLIAAGAAGFLHGRIGPDLGPAIARQLKQAGVFIVPNLGLGELRREAIAEDAFLGAILSPVQARSLRVDANRALRVTEDPDRDAALRSSLGHLLEQQVDIVLGTDAGALPGHPFGYTGHRELEIFVRLGMSPAQALVAATGAAARHLGLDGNGLLREGNRADLLILNADPQLDIRNTRDIHAVYLGGVEVDREGLRRRWSE